MGTVHSIHEGTISAKPFEPAGHGRINAPGDPDDGGKLRAPVGRGHSVHGDAGEATQNAAISELSGLISQLGSLSSQAQTLPLPPPSLPGGPQSPSYQPQPVNYAFDGAN